MTVPEAAPIAAVPQRSIVVMAEDFDIEKLSEARNDLEERIRASGIHPPDFDLGRWTRVFPRLRTLIIPAKASVAIDRDIARPGYRGVIAIDDERQSSLPPGAEHLEQTIKYFVDPLEATRVPQSLQCGSGIHVLILDVGLDTDHPDFQNRRPKPVLRPFVRDPLPNDSGHGTRSTGLVCGPRRPFSGTRYGVAYCAEVVVGQVLSETMGLRDEALLAGIEAAVAEGIAIVNMSLGQDVPPDSSYGSAFEEVAHRALSAGVLLIAAAGNDEKVGAPGVKHPANCPSVLAVGALDGVLEPWSGSCVRMRCDGEVDLVAPGFNIRSSTVGAGYYNVRSSTSSSAAIASGIAALWAEATGRRGCDLWNTLLDAAVLVRGGRRGTTGAGLIQAPVI